MQVSIPFPLTTLHPSFSTIIPDPLLRAKSSFTLIINISHQIVITVHTLNLTQHPVFFLKPIPGSSMTSKPMILGIPSLSPNEKIVAHFNCYAWITVSQSYKMEELLREMIKQFYKAKKEFAPKEIDTMKVISLIEELKHYLREQRYVVIFDDIWNIGFWKHIKCAFLENDKGGRIIITTRSEDVAPSNKESPYYYVYKLPPLPLEKALELFHKKVFQWERGQCPLELYDLSRVIVERCGGLPLAIVAIGGLLSTKAKVVSEWCKVLESLSLEFETNSRLRSITKILSFSYRDLPYNLKACFLNLGMFPEDYSINCARLTRLWIAEGFVRENEGMTLEDVAQDYLNQLIHRSLVQVSEEDFIGRI